MKVKCNGCGLIFDYNAGCMTENNGVITSFCSDTFKLEICKEVNNEKKKDTEVKPQNQPGR